VVVLAQDAFSSPAAQLRATEGTATVRDALRGIVTRLLEGLEAPATDLEHVARRLGVRLRAARELPVSAMLRRDDHGLEVVWAREQSEKRRRFTIAHELAHAYFETHWLGSEPPRVGHEVETLCDSFAAELLMPADVFGPELGDGLSIDLLLRLGDRYKTSLRATAIRCAELRPVSVFVADSRGLLWWKSEQSEYNGFLRAAAARVLTTKQPIEQLATLHRDGVEEQWRLQGDLLPGSRDAILLLTPVG
jgi:Zn-dependent peptidase ImmA (M78 family)